MHLENLFSVNYNTLYRKFKTGPETPHDIFHSNRFVLNLQKISEREPTH